MPRKPAPQWVPDGYTLGYDPRAHKPHIHETVPTQNTPEGAVVVCKQCGGRLVAKNTYEGFRWVLISRLSEGGVLK